jgi:phosphoglycolate phosphatase-like HAD superfamily hydrolase
MTPGVIFDLDQTLIDTSSVEHYRKTRNWRAASNGVKALTPFPFINTILEELSRHGIKSVIITTSPSVYCKAIIEHFNWQVSGAICYHDVSRIKPDPMAFHKALKDYNLEASRTISAGDRDIDILASRAANIAAIACSWASPNPSALMHTKPDYIATKPLELVQLIRQFHGI